MNILVRIFGWPHELLHVLALRLIGRRPLRVQQSHVDIPDDLSTSQFVFVAGLPLLVFSVLSTVSVSFLLNAPDLLQIILWLCVTAFFALALMGTLGDLMLILARLLTPEDS